MRIRHEAGWTRRIRHEAGWTRRFRHRDISLDPEKSRNP
jgi:hypothetical protein